MKNIITTSLLVAVCANQALANDGFYQGAGSSLAPVDNHNLRVLKETLTIIPNQTESCYSILLNGKPLESEDRSFRYTPSSRDKIEIGPRIKCQDKFVTFTPRWKAVVDYQIVALNDQQDVQIGFPVPVWSADFLTADGLYGVRTPSVVNFRTYVDRKQITSLQVKQVRGALKYSNEDKYGWKTGTYLDENENDTTLPVYVWKTSFSGQKQYHLRTEYEFGSAISNDFYEGREYVPGEIPWFRLKDDYLGGAEQIVYYLTPIKSWASPPPEEIRISVGIQQPLDATFAVPLQLKPSCVTTDAIHYHLVNQFPVHELRLSLPNSRIANTEKYGQLRTMEQWNKWKTTLGGDHVSISCDVIRRVALNADSDLKKYISTLKCVSACQP